MSSSHYSKIRVLYDIAILGVGYTNPIVRTGIFRVAENMVVELKRVDHCELTLCSTGGVYAIEDSLNYLENSSRVLNCVFSKPTSFDARLRIKKKIKEIFNKSIAEVSIIDKLKAKQLSLIDKLYSNYGNDFANPQDVNRAQIYHSPFYSIPVKLMSSGVKKFLTCHDLIPLIYPQYVEKGTIVLIKKIIDSITPEIWILCVSNSTRNDLLNYLGDRVDPNKVIVTELAASDIFYRSNDKLKNSQIRFKYNIPEHPYVLSLCTFEPRKNIVQVIRAFKKIVQQEKINDLNLVLVGTKGWMYDRIYEEIKDDTSLKDRIIVTGYVADEDLAAIYSEALVFVYPSFYEGFGLPPLEAMKCGIPVITSNVSSLPEVVGDAGLAVAPTDLDALCSSILSVFTNSSLRDEMVKKSLSRADIFSWKRCAAETVNAYKASLC